MNIDFKVPVLSKLKEIEQSNHPTFLVVIVKSDLSDQQAICLFRKTDYGNENIDSVHDWEKEDKKVWPRIAHALEIFDEIVQAAIDSTVPSERG